MIQYIYSIVPERFHDQLHFVGQITNDRLNEVYNRARLAVFPSIFENFPYVVLESMAAGLPIIGSTSGGMPEMIEEGVSGLLYTPPNDRELAAKILQLYQNPDIADRYGEQAYLKVQKFAPLKVAQQTLEVYEQVCLQHARKERTA